MRISLVCIIGIDGSGKTTIARNLVQKMQDRGVKSRYVWGGFRPTLLLQPVIWLIKSSVYREDRHSYFLPQKGTMLRNKALSKIYHYLVLADYLLQMWVRAGIPRMLGYTVICDRYLQDTIVNMAIVLDYSDDRMLRLLEWMQQLFPRPSVTLLADLPEEAAYRRKDDVPSVAFLSERRIRYQVIAQAHTLPILNSSQPLRALITQALKWLPSF